MSNQEDLEYIFKMDLKKKPKKRYDKSAVMKTDVIFKS